MLARPLTNSDIHQRAAPVVPPLPSQVVIPLEPRPTPSSVAPSHAPSIPVIPVRTTAAARFELVTGVTDLSVRTARLDGDFKVSGPADSAFDDGVLRLSGNGDGSGPVEVQLSDQRVWRLRIGAGTKSVTLNLGAGTISRIDLNGGAERIDITLGRLAATLPIRMAGGVSTWQIRTAGEIPVKVTVGQGAGDIAFYGNHQGGIGAGATLRSGDFTAGPALDITATAGLGTLDIARA
ncbi:hypothetical protein ACWT_4313 [Actinoplanes sp. SE50]|uniref:hypothetical protein n=1 Tax=unclassified Actinoplanes TaxID=2626549 RepID=UPI00023EC7F1|nr:MULTISPECIES: hypothetical protein [unclassified Actinoplanes]AEV85333.1 hypothetical protein ACPL_4442 [Actinoplanes sp. SE50/110]ATO83728.1 hypothetical protein ACWT_4313 [Actinoplanes sp. SE50]SLM01136.1 hypothetical protein ACSP50_4369 [Actinoplanes sp. SE50/110]